MSGYPIVLAHGIARFDHLLQRLTDSISRLGIEFLPETDGLHYFKGIATHLRGHGFDVYNSSVSFAANVERRASDLKNQIELALSVRPGQEKVHIIGHSMGGLDARHMIVRHNMADRVASLTTVGTPHLGTSFADWGIEHRGDRIIEAISRVVDIGGFDDLTTASCNAFNHSAEKAEAANGVIYQVYSAAQPLDQVFSPLRASWKIINEIEGENDGLVSATSQRWQSQIEDGEGAVKVIGQNSLPVPADHLNEIGWWDFDELSARDLLEGNILEKAREYERVIRDFYLRIAIGLRELA